MIHSVTEEDAARESLEVLTRKFKGYPPARVADEVWEWAADHGLRSDSPTGPNISHLALNLGYHRTMTVSRCPDCEVVSVAVQRRRAVQMIREHLTEDHGIARPARHLRKSRGRA